MMWTGEDVAFRFFSSTQHRQDQPGTVRDLTETGGEDEFTEHAPVETSLGASESGQAEAVAVDLRSHLTEIGVLELFCVERHGGATHRLEFNVREEQEEEE